MALITTEWPPPLGKFGLKCLWLSSGLLLLLTALSYIYSLPNLHLIPFLIAEKYYLYLVLPCICVLLLVGICIGLVRATIGRPSKKDLNETGQFLVNIPTMLTAKLSRSLNDNEALYIASVLLFFF